MDTPNPLKNNWFRITGIVFVLLSTIIILFKQCPTNSIRFIIYALIGLGIALLLVESAEHSTFKFSTHNIAVSLAGGVALPFILIFIDPIGRFNQDGCPFPFTPVIVQVHGRRGHQDLILKAKGQVAMEIINKETKYSDINKNGQATFSNVSVGDSVHLGIDFSEPYTAIYPDSIYIIKNNRLLYFRFTYAEAINCKDRLEIVRDGFFQE